MMETPTIKTNEYLNRLENDGDDANEYIDHWDTGELLFLASSVLRSDRNWVSVTRSIKPFGDQTRPADWYTPKNCALQYTKLLSEVDEDSKKKTLPRIERETSEVMLVKNLTDKRLNELVYLNQQTKATSNVLKTYMEMVEAGDFDDHLDGLLRQIDEQETREEVHYNDYLSWRDNLNVAKKLNKSRIAKGKTISKAADSKKKICTYSDNPEDNPHHATVEEIIKNMKKQLEPEEEVTEADAPITLNALLDSKVTIPSSVAPTSPLLTSLLRNIVSSAPTPHTLSSPVKESPRPTPASSPLLNSLLKNSPSSTTHQIKDGSPKAVSSPQSFFSPANALATAAAQQLAVATSAGNQTQLFFQSHELSENKIPSSPGNSACKSAPTLSKLLEMPPSTPGRLPPLPVLDPPSTPTTGNNKSPVQQKMAESPSKKTTESVLQRSLTSYSQASKRAAESAEEKFLHKVIVDTSILDDIDAMDIESTPLEDKEVIIKLEDTMECVQVKTEKISPDSKTTKDLPDHSSKSAKQKNSSADSVVTSSAGDSSLDATEDEKGLNSKKFYKSRHASSSEILLSPKKTIQIKTEPSSPSTTDEVQQEVISPSIKQEESDPESPTAKKPRLFGVDKAELSEDEANSRRSARRGRKCRGRLMRSTPTKQSEPKDQYEFTESTEENSVGYQAANSLCYMPRVKDEDSKTKTGQESEDTSLTEKKLPTPTKNKPGRGTTQQTSARKTLFASDEEERMSDSLTSDEASNHQLSEDKLKMWDEACEKKGDSEKDSSDQIKRTWKGIEIPKKKISPVKKNSPTKATTVKKEPKSSAMEESGDSEDTSAYKAIKEEKESDPVDMEVETTNDSHPSSSNSDKQMEDSFPVKEPLTTFGKEGWMRSPKTPEPVFQSSEDSECESDASDNQSVSTNKSTCQSTGTQPRSKRKERETPEYKAWKKAISIVLRESSCHKNANIFLQKVTNDVAPGYLNIVHRPMDLSLIKKNIDNGIVGTTEEFHRDVLLMFQNALMYNSSDHDVHQMAREMQKDVIQQITAFINTQSTDKEVVSEPITSLRGSRKSLKTSKQVIPASCIKKEEAE